MQKIYPLFVLLSLCLLALSTLTNAGEHYWNMEAGEAIYGEDFLFQENNPVAPTVSEPVTPQLIIENLHESAEENFDPITDLYSGSNDALLGLDLPDNFSESNQPNSVSPTITNESQSITLPISLGSGGALEDVATPTETYDTQWNAPLPNVPPFNGITISPPAYTDYYGNQPSFIPVDYSNEQTILPTNVTSNTNPNTKVNCHWPSNYIANSFRSNAIGLFYS